VAQKSSKGVTTLMRVVKKDNGLTSNSNNSKPPNKEPSYFIKKMILRQKV